ncbi:9 TM domain-containing transmembrane protein [Acrasis kona]|uniref:Transmembrane 9 superfamily member n=1 Tax=Acrasis kona TaxID=1008807 RepID=A0AAW2ZBS9_9EUKA
MNKTASILLLAILTFAIADEISHKYVDKEEVILWANQVGPHYNPQETYGYYTLPFCRPDGELEYKNPSIGEALLGLELVKSKMTFKYKENNQKELICAVKLTKDNLEQFTHAVANQYWYQYYMDDLPMWYLVGGVAQDDDNKEIPFIYTHSKFTIGYNGDRIVGVNLTAGNPVRLELDASITFTYTSTWVESQVEYSQRFKRYLDHNFFEHRIHWFSIFNSFMMVIFLSGLVFMILVRTLRSDLADLESGYDSDGDITDESGWKQIHGDVFRAPKLLTLFSALIGTGYQLLLIVFFLILIAILGNYYDTRGAMVTAAVITYCITSFVSGYFSGSFYSKHGGKHWIKTMIVTACLFPMFLFACTFALNSIAIAYNALIAIPPKTVFSIIAMWTGITVPLVFLGTIVGRNIAGKSDFPCRVNSYPRPIPQKPYYLSRLVFVVLGGVLPFGSIFIEMYFVFTSFWNYKFYYVYGFMLLVFVILIIVTICVSIVSTYFLLNAEDHRWAWTSFLSTASTALYVLLYAFYFYRTKTKMQGFFQFCFYFGNMFMFCTALAILCGTIGFIGTQSFVYRIYKNIKAD